MAGYDGLEASFAQRLKALADGSGGRVSIYSGFRSVEDQTELWNNALAKYGSEEAARQWVAPPGHSNHNKGWAADLEFADDNARQWVHDNAHRYGLTFPMEWEPWHIEPAEARGSADVEAYTLPTDGEAPVDDPSRKFDIGYQMMSFMGILQGMGKEPGGGRPDPASADTRSTMSNPLPGFGEMIRSAAPGGTDAAQLAQPEVQQ